MNWHSKLICLILALVMSAPLPGWAGVNPDNPYCEHEGPCWEPNDDWTWQGADCCRRKEKPPHPDPTSPCWKYDEDICKWETIDPGPKPAGCYKLNSKCEWEKYTPDCKWFEDKYTALTLHMYTMMKRAFLYKAALNGDLSDDKRIQIQRAYDDCIRSADVANRNRDEVKVDWDDCLNCR